MQRKRVILHIGAPKTGSTYLQAFFSLHASSLRQAGVDYPCALAESVVASGSAVGNVVTILARAGLLRLASDPAGMPQLWALWTPACTAELVATVNRSACDTVLLSAEGMALLPQEVLEELYEQLATDCDPEFIMFVRDPYDCCYSAWRQRVKNGRFLGSFEEFAAQRVHGGPEPARTLGMFHASQVFFNTNVTYTLINYDGCREALADAFLQAAGIDAAVGHSHSPIAGKTYNRSLSLSEALVLGSVNNVFAGSHFPAFFRRTLLARTNYRPGTAQYYNREIDAMILDTYRMCIEKINAVVRGGPLRTRPRQTPTGQAGIDEQDVDALLQALHVVAEHRSRSIPLLQKLKHVVMVALLKNVPRDFDPDAYQFMHPDVAAAGVNPYLHYARHGCRECRPYRYY